MENYSLILAHSNLNDLIEDYNNMDASTQRFIDFINAFNIEVQIDNTWPNQPDHIYTSNSMEILEQLRALFIGDSSWTTEELPIYTNQI